jgi:arylsulfatase A-like enzyme
MRSSTERTRCWLAIAGLVLWMAAPESTCVAADPAKPNIVIILADDLGNADLGFQGCRDIPTPRIDSLAQNGVRCTNGYVSCPYCSPTRAGLLTGRYQQRFGHEFNPGPVAARDDKFGLPLSETTLADRLKAAGYVTGLVGKWHLGETSQFQPQKRGFEEYFGFLGGGHAYFPGQGAPIYRGTEGVEEKEYLTDAFARVAVAFVERHKDQPFFLYLAFNAVHTPMHATDDRLSRFTSIADEERRTYAAMLTAMDEGVGKVLDTLKAAHLEENTLIFFFSDNGGPTMLGTTINGSRNEPLRGSKRTTLEGGIHVPFVVQWKGKLAPGTVYNQPVIQLDVLPTALAAAGVAAKPDWRLDGVNLLPHLQGDVKVPPHTRLYWRLGEQWAVRQGDWKLVRYDQTLDTPGARSVPSSIKVTQPRLYNLVRDLGETHDLAAEQSDKVAELLGLWNDWNSQLAQPLWGPGSGPTNGKKAE